MKIIKLFCSLMFIIFLTACDFLSKTNENEDATVAGNAQPLPYKEGEIVLRTESLKDILVVQIPHLGEPVPNGLILIVMDKDWGGGYFNNQNKVWHRMSAILNTKGADICRFDNSDRKDNHTAASIVEVEGNEVQRVMDRRIYSDDPLLLDSEIYYVKLTEGVVTELTLSKGGNIFLATGEESSFEERSISSEINVLEYVDLVSASLMGGLNCPRMGI